MTAAARFAAVRLSTWSGFGEIRKARVAITAPYVYKGHDHPFGQKNLDYASQAPLHPGYTGFGPNDDHGLYKLRELRSIRSDKAAGGCCPVVATVRARTGSGAV